MAVRIDISGHVAEITFDRPAALNALDVEHLVALRSCLVRARDDGYGEPGTDCASASQRLHGRCG